MTVKTKGVAYQFKVTLQGIQPEVWRLRGPISGGRSHLRLKYRGRDGRG